MTTDNDMPDAIWCGIHSSKEGTCHYIANPYEMSGFVKYIRSDKLAKVREALSLYAYLNETDTPYEDWYNDEGNRAKQALAILDNLEVE